MKTMWEVGGWGEKHVGGGRLGPKKLGGGRLRGSVMGPTSSSTRRQSASQSGKFWRTYILGAQKLSKCTTNTAEISQLIKESSKGAPPPLSSTNSTFTTCLQPWKNTNLGTRSAQYILGRWELLMMFRLVPIIQVRCRA